MTSDERPKQNYMEDLQYTVEKTRHAEKQNEIVMSESERQREEGMLQIKPMVSAAGRMAGLSIGRHSVC